MSEIDLHTANLAGSAHLDVIGLFQHADIVVQIVMGGLLLASIVAWTIIIAFSVRIGRLNRDCDEFENSVMKTRDITSVKTDGSHGRNPSAKVAKAALTELSLSFATNPHDRENLQQRLSMVMDGVVGEETEKLGGRLNFLATTGSVAPFVGLFGTVWGIINSFFQIGQQQNSSLAVVAPGISEALVATAIGLFVAIPSVIAYNHFSNRVACFETRLQRFADRFHVRLNRELGAR